MNEMLMLFLVGIAIGGLLGAVTVSMLSTGNTYVDKLQEAYDHGYIDGYDQAKVDAKRKGEGA